MLRERTPSFFTLSRSSPHLLTNYEEFTDVVNLIGLGSRNTSMTSSISSACRRNEERRASKLSWWTSSPQIAIKTDVTEWDQLGLLFLFLEPPSLEVVFVKKTEWIIKNTGYAMLLKDAIVVKDTIEKARLWQCDDVVAEQSSLPDSSSGVSSRMWVRIPAVTLVSLSKTLNHNCFSPPRG